MAQTDPAVDPASIRLVSFDCYGTLIDWEHGILSALRVLLASRGEIPPAGELLAAYSELEREAERPPYRPYRDVLKTVVGGIATRAGFLPDASELETLVRSLPAWRPFEDTVPALRRLADRYPLAVCSNIDDDLFARTARHLEVPFAHVITAEQTGSYKPDPGHFAELIRRTGLKAPDVLHAAQSLFHDIAPARALGFRTAWVRRPSERARFGATPAADARPDIEAHSLTALAAALGA